MIPELMMMIVPVMSRESVPVIKEGWALKKVAGEVSMLDC